MLRSLRAALLVGAAILLLAAACTPQAAPTPTAGATIAPSAVPVGPSPTTAPTEQAATAPPTAAPSATASPPAPSPQATSATLAPGGPWRIIAAEDGLWALNAGGTGLTRLADLSPRRNPTGLAIAPRGGKIAFSTGTMVGGSAWNLTDPTLELLSLPDGSVRTLAALAPPGHASDPDDPLFEALRATGMYESLAWSPDGRQLAFISAEDGVSADLYVYSVDNDQITRLMSEPDQAFRPVWSPDGRTIVVATASSFGTGAGFAMTGVWLARADGSGAERLYVPRGGSEVVVGWAAPDTFLVYAHDMVCGPASLRTVQVPSGAEHVFRSECFDAVAYDPATATALFLLSDRFGDEQGIYRLSASDGTVERLAEPPYPVHLVDAVDWSAEAGLFLVLQRDFDTLLAYAPSGQRVELPDFGQPVGEQNRPVAAPGGSAWAMASPGDEAAPGLWVAAGGQPPRQVFAEPALRAAWSPDGQTLLFFGSSGDPDEPYGGQGLYVARAPAFEPVLVSPDVRVPQMFGPWHAGWVNP